MNSKGGVFILDMYPDGLAEKSGILKRGDQILDFCAENFKAIERERAENTILSANGAVSMINMNHMINMINVNNMNTMVNINNMINMNTMINLKMMINMNTMVNMNTAINTIK